MHLLFFFSLQQWNPSICHSSILSPCALLLLCPSCPRNPQKEGFWCRVEKSSQGKKWFRPTQPFVFPLNKGSDKARAWCTSVVGTGARRSSAARAELCFTANRVFFTVASATPDEDIMFYSTQLLRVSTWFASACFGEKGSGDALKSSPDTRDVEAPFWGMRVWSEAPKLRGLNQSCKRGWCRLKERAESNPPSPLRQFPKEICDYRQEGKSVALLYRERTAITQWCPHRTKDLSWIHQEEARPNLTTQLAPPLSHPGPAIGVRKATK